jgi:hypothetical protein
MGNMFIGSMGPRQFYVLSETIINAYVIAR